MFKPAEQLIRLMLRDLTLARLTFAEWISSLKADDINFCLDLTGEIVHARNC